MQGHEVKVHACHRTSSGKLATLCNTHTTDNVTLQCKCSCPALLPLCIVTEPPPPSLLVSLCCVTTGRGRSPALTETLPRPPPARCTSPAPYPAHHTLDLSTNLREVKLGCLPQKILTNGWLSGSLLTKLPNHYDPCGQASQFHIYLPCFSACIA